MPSKYGHTGTHTLKKNKQLRDLSWVKWKSGTGSHQENIPIPNGGQKGAVKICTPPHPYPKKIKLKKCQGILFRGLNGNQGEWEPRKSTQELLRPLPLPVTFPEPLPSRSSKRGSPFLGSSGRSWRGSRSRLRPDEPSLTWMFT